MSALHVEVRLKQLTIARRPLGLTKSASRSFRLFSPAKSIVSTIAEGGVN